MKKKSNEFLIGGSLVPLGLYTHMPMDEWEKSFRQMRELGFNSIRMFLSWARVERQEGVLDFTENDYAFELAEKYGLKVLVNVGGLFHILQGYSAPAWLLHKYHLTRVLENPLYSQEYRNPDMQICADDPLYREKAYAFIKKAVERYKDHPMLEGWSIWNEPHAVSCYCEHTLARFREWLKKKYGTLENLNKNWESSYPVDFPTWEEVRPIYHQPGRIRNLVMMMDFQTFSLENHIGSFNEICEIVHNLDPNHTTTLNMQGIHGRDISNYHVKTAGISAYYEAFHDPRKIYMWANLYMRSARVGLALEDKVRIIETDSGPRPDNVERAGCQKSAAVCDWSMVALGAEQILTWIYRTRIDGGHSLQSQMCDFYGDVTPRLKEFAARARTIRENEKLILSSHPFRGQIGIWWDVSLFYYGNVENNAAARNDMLCTSHDNALMAALDHGYQADYLNDKQLLAGEFGKYKAVFVPYRPYMTAEYAASLQKYVEEGGLLIVESQFAVKDENMRQTWRPSPGGLKEVFGVDCHDMLLFRKENDYIELNNGERFSAALYRMELRPDPDTEILARFADGAPAITSHKYGKGRAVFIGALVTPGYTPSSPLGRFLASEWQKAGITPLCQGLAAEDVGLYPVTGDGKGFSMLYVINYCRENRPVEIVPDPSFLKKKTFKDLITGEKYTLPCKVELKPMQNLILAAEE